MKRIVKRLITVGLSLLIATSILIAAGYTLRFETSGDERFFAGEAQTYYQGLLEVGFPSDYAISLTELHLLHPTWQFKPLLVTETNTKYTWNYVIGKETENPKTNLIPRSSTYSAYHHPTNTELYDSGYYQASVETVEYFMDPRNFLNETDIFQFYDLSLDTAARIEEVDAVLAGTFMDSGTLENGKSYAAYLCEVGEALGINPVYLAAKVRQEQGTDGTSAIISGNCGTLLSDFYQNQTQTSPGGKPVNPPTEGHTVEELQGLNGYYNFFNVKASGTGLFSIYYNAMKRAVQGTPSMSEAWDSNPSWNTRWKSLYGGAYLLKTDYIDKYQSTVYLQKFNVDGRVSGQNFWKQYMQNVSGSLSESRSLYSAFASVDALDSTCVFLIPVYGQMPSKICTDPAKGTCTLLAQATNRFTYQTELTAPSRLRAQGYPIYANHSIESGSAFSLRGTVSHDYGVKKIQFRLDDGEWTTISNDKRFDLTISEQFLPNTVHILTVRGIADYDNSESTKKHSYAFLCAVYYLQILPPEHELILTTEERTAVTTHTDGEQLVLPDCDLTGFVGWLGTDDRFLPAGASITMDQDYSFRAITLPFYRLGGASLNLDGTTPRLQFSSILGAPEVTELMQRDHIRLCANMNDGTSTVPISILSTQSNKDWLKINASTPPLSDFEKRYAVIFFAELLYTDGSIRTLYASGTDYSRDVVSVARAALADPLGGYSPEEVAYLRTLISDQS